MPGLNLKHVAVVLIVYLLLTPSAFAQVIETVGSRALGRGGALVAVAPDSSATGWNPAGLASGPYLDLALARGMTEQPTQLPARRETATWFALGTPAIGVSYYRFRLTDVRPHPTAVDAGNRQDEVAGVPVRSLAAKQLGIKLVPTLVGGIYAGSTFKYFRGTLPTGRDDGCLPASGLL